MDHGPQHARRDEDSLASRHWLETLGVLPGHPQLVTITPEMARAFYTHRAKNRHIAKTNLQRILTSIKGGKWKVTGETIIFDHQDQLIDGQHRLLACMEANVPIQTYVVRGKIDTDAATNIDTGKARTPGDLLTFNDYSDPNHLAATVRWINRLTTEGMQFERVKMTRDALLQFVQAHEEVHLSLPYGRFVRALIVPSLGAALHYLMAQHDRELANTYFLELQQGTGAIGSPSFVVRELLIKNKMHRAQLPVHIVAAMLIKAWNLLRAGRTAKIIRWYGEAQNEPYPTIR